MITREQALDIFREAGVLMEGHFSLTSGRHSDKYMQCARIFQRADLSERLCRELASRFSDIDVVIGPAIGAIQMAYEVSRHLNCRNIFSEREGGVFVLRRGFELSPGDRVLVVEDTVTTGGSVREVLELVRSLRGEIAGIGCLVDRSGGNVDFGAPLESVLSVDVVSWEKDDCPLCAAGVPCIKPGSRRT